MAYIFTSEKRIAELKQKISNDKRMKRELIDLAQNAMNQEPLSVTFHKSPAASGDIHDYFSEGTYWWPDSQDPVGPYIRRDGHHNPDVFKHHLNDMGELCRTVFVLSCAGVYLEDKKYFEKAIELIKVWFINDETKMNPNLNHAQAIRGHCDGRGIGIIDTVRLISLVYGVNLIEETGLYNKEINALKDWFREYTHWLNTSANGLEEKNYFNNHSNWWNTQVATYCAFTGNEELLKECFRKYKTDILVNQVDTEGKFVDEITRTLSYTYTIYNTEACALLCEIAYYKGIDLWNYTAENSNSLKNCINFFKPFYKNAMLWEYEQLNFIRCCGEKLPFKLAAIRYGDKELESINEERRENIIPFTATSTLGLIDLI